MKKFLQTTILSLLTFAAVSCNGFLTVEPKDTIMADNYYTSSAAIRANTSVLYASIPWFYFHGMFMFYAGDMRPGDIYYTNDQEGQYYYNNVTSTNSYLYNGWLGLYRVVSFCNSVLIDMPDPARANGVSESVISAAQGEAYCMRAMAYYFLTEYWGEVPIIENATALITSSSPQDIYVQRATHDSLFRFMIRDLKRAVDMLPEKDDPGRVTKWSALGLLAKIQLTYADYSGDASLFDEAKENALAAVEGGLANGYGLYADYQTMFDVDANNCCESLIAIQCTTGALAEGNARNVNFSRSSRIADQTWGDSKGPTISVQNIYDSNDLRKTAVYMTNGDYYANLDKDEGGYIYQYSYRDPNNLDTQLEYPNPVLAHIKKYVIGKASDCGGNVGLNQDAANNLYLLRFADVMMVYIEACIGAGDSTSDPTALDFMSQILARAGLTSTYTAITFDDLILERRKEFAMEGINWFDVLRMWYRDNDKGLAYLNDMNRDLKYTFNWAGDFITRDNAGNASYTIDEMYEWENDINCYTTIWEGMDISSELSDGSINYDYYKGAEWLEENGHRVNNIVFTNSTMYFSIPESEVTDAPILREPAIDYEFDD